MARRQGCVRYNPVQAAEYIVSRGLEEEAVSKQWVPYTLRKRDVIIYAVNSGYMSTTNIYGIEVPKTIEQALRLDQQNGNTMRFDATNKEMANVGIAFEIQPRDVTNAPPGWVVIFEFTQTRRAQDNVLQ